jgi:hypothetical protein
MKQFCVLSVAAVLMIGCSGSDILSPAPGNGVNYPVSPGVLNIM